jgi:hypothetical protein
VSGIALLRTNLEPRSITYQLRVYTLKDTASLEAFRTVQYPRHFASFAEFGMSIQGIWTSPADGTRTKLYAIIRYPDGKDPDKVLGEYLDSAGFKADMVGFDPDDIVDVESTLLTPSNASPLW